MNHAKDFDKRGFALLPDFVSHTECKRIADRIVELDSSDALLAVNRRSRAGVMRFSTINGPELEESIPIVSKLYEQTNELVNEITGLEWAELDNRRIGLSINVTPPLGQFKLHYDRNAITAVLYVNEVQGGEMELYPRHRLTLANSQESIWWSLQRYTDYCYRSQIVRMLTMKRHLITPSAGQLLIFNGKTCLHGVRPVRGTTSRVSLQMAFDSPTVRFEYESNQDYYGYGEDQTQPTAAAS